MDRPPITIDAAGVLARAKRRTDYCRTWLDFDAAQWFTAEKDGLTPGIQLDRSGHLRFAAAKGSAFAAGAYTELWYHLHSGLSTEQDIFGVAFDWRSSGTMTWRVYEVVLPYDGASFTQLGTGGGATNATPDSAAYDCSAGKRGLALRVEYTGATTLTADEFVEITELRVYGQDGDPSIGGALTDILVATGLAGSYYSKSVG